jgi:hypothetical protein
MHVGKMTKTLLKFTHKMVKFLIQTHNCIQLGNNNWLLNYLVTNKIILAAGIIN